MGIVVPKSSSRLADSSWSPSSCRLRLFSLVGAFASFTSCVCSLPCTRVCVCNRTACACAPWSAPSTATSTPHSQLRQLSLGLPDSRSFVSRPLEPNSGQPYGRSTSLHCVPLRWPPTTSLLAFAASAVAVLAVSNCLGLMMTYHALSDRFALPIYTQAAPSRICSWTNMTLLCSSRPCRVASQSRSNSRGKVVAFHHFSCMQIVPAACEVT